MFSRLLLKTVVLAMASGTATATPVLNEVLYDAEGSDPPFVFTEIFGAPGTSLDGWSLVGVNGASGTPYRVVDLTGAALPEDGVLVVATASASGDVLLQRDFVGDVDWQNGPDVVELWNDLGVRVDALQYGMVPGGMLGEGSPAPDVEAGLALTRDSWSSDTNDNAADFTAAPPTPGVAGSTPPPPSPFPVPEPDVLPMLALGAAFLIPRGRRAQGRVPILRTTSPRDGFRRTSTTT